MKGYNIAVYHCLNYKTDYAFVGISHQQPDYESLLFTPVFNSTFRGRQLVNSSTAKALPVSRQLFETPWLPKPIATFAASTIKRQTLKSKHLHLVLSVIIIVPVALTYGLLPGGFFENIFHFKFETIELSGIFRAVMGLYIAMAIFWSIGIFKPKFWMAATLSNVLFMAGLALGRSVSILLDGIPSPVFLVGLLGEILLAAWGIFNLRKYKD